MNSTITQLQQTCDRLESQIAEYTSLDRTISRTGEIIYELDYAGHGEHEYLAKTYSSVMPSMCPGLVRCEDWAEAKLFLTLLLERYASGGTIDPQIPNKIAGCIYLEGWRDAITSNVIDCNTEDLPIKDAEIPYWVAESMPSRKDIEVEHFLYTLEESNTYLSYPSSSLPAVEGCLLVEVNGQDSESCVELGSKEEGRYDSFNDYWGVEGSSLEAFLALQMVCHNKNLAVEFPQYAYIHYQLMGGIWLRPIPDAIASFLALRKAKYGCFITNHNFGSDRDDNIREWLDRLESAIDEDTEDAIVALIRKTRSEY